MERHADTGLSPSAFAFVAGTASLASAATNSCSTSVACTVFANNSSGPGVEGASAQGVGALGETSSGTFEGAGIEGGSLDHHGFAVVSIGAKPERLPLPISPEQRLENRIGTEAYAKPMLSLGNRLTGPR